MGILHYIFWLIIGPAAATVLAVTAFRKVYRAIFIIEGLIVIFFTYVDILQNGPYGTLSMQLGSYLGNITNNFYTMYLPFLVITIIAVTIFFKNKNTFQVGFKKKQP